VADGTLPAVAVELLPANLGRKRARIFCSAGNGTDTEGNGCDLWDTPGGLPLGWLPPGGIISFDNTAAIYVAAQSVTSDSGVSQFLVMEEY
jgi:hypothetical protein